MEDPENSESFDYEFLSFDPSFNYDNLKHAINLRKARDKHTEFWHILNNMIDGIHHYQESFKAKQNEWEKGESKTK